MELVIAGHVVLVGLRVTSEAALKDFLFRLDHCQIFTLAAGGFYCSEQKMMQEASAETTAVTADGSLPLGCHTSWYGPLQGRPYLLQEAKETSHHTPAAVGFLVLSLHWGFPKTENVNDSKKLPPVIAGALRFMKGVPVLVDGRNKRRCARTLHKALFEFDPFDHTALRQLIT